MTAAKENAMRDPAVIRRELERAEALLRRAFLRVDRLIAELEEELRIAEVGSTSVSAGERRVGTHKRRRAVVCDPRSALLSPHVAIRAAEAVRRPYPWLRYEALMTVIDVKLRRIEVIRLLGINRRPALQRALDSENPTIKRQAVATQESIEQQIVGLVAPVDGIRLRLRLVALGLVAGGAITYALLRWAPR